MTIIVTGGAGFIGSNFIFHMLKKYPDYRIICLDKLTYAGNLSTLEPVMNNPNFRFVKADICDRKAVNKLFEEEHPDIVVNFAAESHVDRVALCHQLQGFPLRFADFPVGDHPQGVPLSVAQGVVHLPAPVRTERCGASDAPVQQVFHRRAEAAVAVFRKDDQVIAGSEHAAGLVQGVLHLTGRRMLRPAFEAPLAGCVPSVRADHPVRGSKQPFVHFFPEIVDDGFHTVFPFAFMAGRMPAAGPMIPVSAGNTILPRLRCTKG